MKRSLLLACVLSSALASAVALAAEPSAPTKSPPGGRDAAAIVKEFEEAKVPAVDSARVNDPNYRREYIAERQRVMDRRAELAQELYKKDPAHEKAGAMLSERWMILTQTGRANKALEEAEQFLKAHPDSPHKAEALFTRGVALGSTGDTAKAREAAEQFVALKPADERGAQLLVQLAMSTRDQAQQRELFKLVAEKYPDTRAGKMAASQMRRSEAVGKPFELSFTEAVTGKPVSMKDLKGKVVVVDFWATWCGPCVAEMPKMKQLYAEYKDKGVEFIGVSLDQPEAQGGLTKLKEFVAKNDIPWPQYYQGNGWESDFSKSWGINSIPAVFIVDADGNLHSTEARGKLEQMIPELLKKGDESKTRADAAP